MSRSIFSLNRSAALLAALLAAVSPLLAANPTLPKLLPAFPDAVETTDDEIVPDSPVLLDDEPIKPKPLAARKPTAKRSTARQASYDAPPTQGEDEIVLPADFLDDTSDTVQKPQTKKKTVRSIETAQGVKPQPDYSGYFAAMPKQQKTSNDGEFFVADTEYPVNAPSGVYNEVSPSFAAGAADNSALNNSYACPMMVKCFGTGLLDNLTLFGGVSGFKAETDIGSGTNGNFGFHEGFNWSGPATPQETVCAQAGFRFIQSDMFGNSVTKKSSRNQYFFTAGVFKRFPLYPLQGGFVFDYMHDDLQGKSAVSQGRYELSVRTFRNLEYGFLGTTGLSKQSSVSTNRRGNLFYSTLDGTYFIQAQQSYVIFIRKHFAVGGTAEVRSGATDNGDAILALMGECPVSDRWAVHGGFSMMIPKEGHGSNGWKRETWEMSLGAVFYFRGGASSKTANIYRPMFNVAGNGTFYNRLR